MTILAIDTSNHVLGVSIIREDQILGEFTSNVKKNHAIRAMPAIEKLCRECSVVPKDFTRIVVAQGPGSYTGVRMGVTIAKTLAWTLNVELVGISSLEVVAQNAKGFSGYIIPITDARRGQVFAGVYKMNGNKTEIIMKDQLMMLDSLLEKLKEETVDVMFLGTDVDMHKDVILNALGNKYVEAPKTWNLPRPSELAFLGSEREPVDVHTFVPEYLRLAEAEANWLKGQKNENR